MTEDVGRRGSLTRRLTAAFVLVGLLSAIAVVGIVRLSAGRTAHAVGADQREVKAVEVAQVLSRAYRAAGEDWEEVGFSGAARWASASQAALIVRDLSGRIVGVTSPGGTVLNPARRPLPARYAKVRVENVNSNRRLVGRAELRFTGAELSGGEQRLRNALVRSAGWAALAALAIAIAAAWFVSRRIRTPLQRLTGAARAVEAGDTSARAAQSEAPGELGEVSQAFDHLADALDAQRVARAEMVSDLAHELRTPLTILRGGLEEMIDGDAPADAAGLASLQDEVLRVERLTDDLRALADSEPAAVDLELAELDLAAVVERAVQAITARARSAEIEVVFDAGRAAVHVRGDARRLEQVATNLLVNAVKFTPAGGHVHAEVGREGDAAVFIVSDTGPGIAEDELPHVFERFWRGRAASGIGGTGVGLAIVERLVAAHGGSVSAERPERGGARFTVRLPAAR